MTEYPEDYPTLSAGPPPVTYSDRVYDYPADPPPRPPWLTPVSIIGACIAVIALVAAATAILVRSTVPHDFPAPPDRHLDEHVGVDGGEHVGEHRDAAATTSPGRLAPPR